MFTRAFRSARALVTGHGAALKALVADRQLTSGHGVYTGAAELKDGPVRVWPLERFLARLSAGDILA